MTGIPGHDHLCHPDEPACADLREQARTALLNPSPANGPTVVLPPVADRITTHQLLPGGGDCWDHGQAPLPLEVQLAEAHAQVQHLTEALALIASGGVTGNTPRCETSTDENTACRTLRSGRLRGARYGAERWCLPCIAIAALDGA